ncbi:tumor necrosis factor receptor superfamily member 5 [Leuresthes tenuis]|uniref:tumor necrosis factor receptor superfamily member 5 n=1 Tax=Leuresthes tenuis TaxID=355514 RepID=UPI003B500783
MANMCENDKYKGKDGTCCDRCPAGHYVQVECSATQGTKCDNCRHGHYTATTNYLLKCEVCKNCFERNKLKQVSECTADRNTVCECLEGFFCSTDECDHCKKVTSCGLGFGVKHQATRTNDTICVACAKGSYSNVTDYISSCKPHTRFTHTFFEGIFTSIISYVTCRCEDLGRDLRSPGNSTADATCGNFKSHCSWMLPAGLWSGLVLTILIVAVFFLWRARRKSYKSDSCTIPVTLMEIAPAPPLSPLELSSHCQESGTEDDYKLFNTDDTLINCSSLPIIQRKLSVSFVESNHNKESSGYNPANFLRCHSEPQEDEWCGT